MPANFRTHNSTVGLTALLRDYLYEHKGKSFRRSHLYSVALEQFPDLLPDDMGPTLAMMAKRKRFPVVSEGGHWRAAPELARPLGD